MKDSIIRTVLSIVTVFALIACVSMILTSCNGGTSDETTAAQTTAAAEETTAQSASETGEATTANEAATEMGVGENTFVVTFTFADGTAHTYDISTNEKTVGAALLGLKLISGEPGDYGLYIKTVDGVTADYATDGSYWAFYINGEYALTGVDGTDITAGSTYELRVETAQQ